MPRMKGAVIDVDTPAAQWNWKVHFSEHVSRIAVSPDGGQVAVATLAGEAVLLATSDGTRLRELPAHGFGTLDIAWCPDGSAIATAGQDGIVRVIDVTTGAVRGEHQSAGWASRVVWSNDGTRLAAAIGKNTVLMKREGAVVGSFGEMPHTVTDVVWTIDDRKLGVLTYGGIRWFGTGAPKSSPDRVFAWKGAPLCAVMSPSGKFVVHGNQDNSVHVWKMGSAEEMEMSGFPAKIDMVSWDRTGEWLAIGTVGFTAVWDCSGKGPGGRRAVVCEGPERRVSGLSWQRRGDVVLVGSADGIVRWYRPAKAKAGTNLQPLGSLDVGTEVSGISFLSDDRLFVIAGSDGTVGVASTDLSTKV
jgi:WD40 repeat protein